MPTSAMNKYLLLRDNKQTGPYTLEDIRALGVKPYDLIWVEGRSAAWRYPGEIEEFKSFAPAVEEQPFDRFFKKPSGESYMPRPAAEKQMTEEKPRIIAENKTRIIAGDENSSNKEQESKPRTADLKPAADASESINTPSTQKPGDKETKRPKYVSVSMPSGMQKISQPSAKDDREQKPVIKSQTENSRKEVVTNTVQPEKKLPETTREERISVSPPPVQHTQRSQSGGNVMQVFALAAAVISLLAVGILIGMGIGSSRIQQDAKPAVQHVAAESAETAQENAPVNNILQPVSSLQTDTVSKPMVNDQKDKVKKTAVKPVVSDKTVPVETVVVKENPPPAPVETTKIADPKELAKQNISKMISVRTNDYKVGMFGGIDDVEVTVNNTSDYPVDLVVVDVTYIQSNKKSYKTESLHFKDIAANSSLTLVAPKTNKGIKVKTALTHISSKALGVSENIW